MLEFIPFVDKDPIDLGIAGQKRSGPFVAEVTDVHFGELFLEMANQGGGEKHIADAEDVDDENLFVNHKI